MLTPLLQMAPWAFGFVKHLLSGTLPKPPEADLVWNQKPATAVWNQKPPDASLM